MIITLNDSLTGWEFYPDDKTWSFFNPMFPKTDDKADKDMMITHCFLEVLNSLNIVEYGQYYEDVYEITIKVI